MLQFDHIKLSDSSGQLQIKYYDTPVGELSAQDTTWFRINQGIAKNIYTPRYIRADGGLFVDDTNHGINGSGVLTNASLTGTYTNALTLNNASNNISGTIYTDHVRSKGGQELVITAGESAASLSPSSLNDEYVHIAGEQGVKIYASSDNLTSGLNRNTTLIDTAGNAAFGQFGAYTTGGTARITSKTVSTSGVAISMGSSNTNMSYIRQNGNGIFEWQTYNGGNSGNLLFQRYGGNVGIGSSSPSVKLDVSGDLKITGGALGVNKTPSTTDGRIDAGNDIVAFSTSDKRLKENITKIENPLEKISKIRGVEFDWIPLTRFQERTIHGNKGHDIGVIAQEIEEIYPLMVTERARNKFKAVRYEKLIPLLLEGIKEQQSTIVELKERIEKLENK